MFPEIEPSRICDPSPGQDDSSPVHRDWITRLGSGRGMGNVPRALDLVTRLSGIVALIMGNVTRVLGIVTRDKPLIVARLGPDRGVTRVMGTVTRA